MHLISETEIIARCKKQDRNAQELLFRQYATYMMGICMRYSRNREDAQDLLHEGFIKAFQAIKDFREQSSLKTWLASIFVNTALSYLRIKNRHPVIHLDEEINHGPEQPDDSDSLPDHVFYDLNIDEVLAYVQCLPDKYRLIINLYVIDDFSHAEIAKALNISEGTSKSQLSRARKLLGKLIMQKKTQYEKAS
jgi:RNA polymerase sigma factor (sigma-70 family)